jgi:hypothetical protein
MATIDPVDVMTRFCGTWKSGDPDALIEIFDDDATYQNIMDDIGAWHDYYDNAQFRRMLHHPPRDSDHPDDSDLGVAAPSARSATAC